MSAPTEPDDRRPGAESDGNLTPAGRDRPGQPSHEADTPFRILSAEFSADIYRGPLAPPHYVEAYKKVGVKDAGERFLRIAERVIDHEMQMDREEAAHRREMDTADLRAVTDADAADGRREQTSRWIGLLAVAMCVLLSGFLGSYCGSPAAAAAVACGVLVSMASVFIFGRRTDPPAEPKQPPGDPSKTPPADGGRS